MCVFRRCMLGTKTNCRSQNRQLLLARQPTTASALRSGGAQGTPVQPVAPRPPRTRRIKPLGPARNDKQLRASLCLTAIQRELDARRMMTTEQTPANQQILRVCAAYLYLAMQVHQILDAAHIGIVMDVS